MPRFRSALLATTLLALPVAAQAQPVSGVYIGAGVGWNWMLESDVSLSANFPGGAAGRSGNLEWDRGVAAVASLGWGYGNGLRVEVEGNIRQNKADSLSGFNGVLTQRIQTDGRTNSYGAMLNALYDFNVGLDFMVPYVGVGVGYMWQDNVSVRGRGANNNAIFIPGGDGQFAYQAILGAAFPVAAAPGLAFTVEYRFTASLERDVNAAAATPGVVTQGKATLDNQNNSILFGIRYAFGAAPPPPPPVVAPAAAPAPARTFLVFFDFDRADLTDRARQIIGEAATNAQGSGTTRIEISGHADTVGSAQYNQALSVRRANAVAAELERRGVARSAMTIQGFGFTRPLVPTGPNVREPQNRRVEIVLR
jgi:outer membrane protein OmpA-like peptidoglycan-associated protein